jgi:hypothetical protein
MSALTRKHEEAKRLLETYTLHKDNPDIEVRRKVHLDLDRFLMENRETAIVCVERVIAAELKDLLAEKRKETKRQARLMRPSIFKRVVSTIQRHVQKEESTNDNTV